MAGILLVAAVGSIYAFALAHHGGGSADKSLPSKSAARSAESAFSGLAPQSPKITDDRGLSGEAELGQFPPGTEAESELEKMLGGKDESIDLALANWLVAADVPEFADMTRKSYFAQLDGMINQVRQEMARMQNAAVSRGKNLSDPDTRCSIFCNAIIKLRFAYREEFAQHDLTPLQNKALHGDPNNTFLAGLLRTQRGSCVSMPLIYLVIGQRLGFPVHLVVIGKHYFIRWEESRYRLNIETTRVDKVWVTDDDAAYIEEEGMTRDQVTGSELRNLTNREVVGNLLFNRSAYWVMRAEKSHGKSWADLSRAFHLSSDDPAIAKTYHGIFAQYGIKPEHTVADIMFRAKECDAVPRASNSGSEPPWIPPSAQGNAGPGRKNGLQQSLQELGYGLDASRVPANLPPRDAWNNAQSPAGVMPTRIGKLQPFSVPLSPGPEGRRPDGRPIN